MVSVQLVVSVAEEKFAVTNQDANAATAIAVVNKTLNPNI